jgi:hypothetical protein
MQVRDEQVVYAADVVRRFKMMLRGYQTAVPSCAKLLASRSVHAGRLAPTSKSPTFHHH